MKNKIEEILKNNGGITLNHEGEVVELDEGFIISYNKYEYTTTNINEAINKLEEYKNIIKNKKALYCGAWLDEGVWYIDINVMIKDKIEALEFGRRQNQKAIFNNKIKKSLYLRNYNFKKTYTLYDRGYLLAQFDSLKEVEAFLGVPHSVVKNLSAREIVGYKIKLDYFIEEV